VILAGRIKNEKKMRGMNMRITICFGDRTRCGTFFTEILKKSKRAVFLRVASASHLDLE